MLHPLQFVEFVPYGTAIPHTKELTFLKAYQHRLMHVYRSAERPYYRCTESVYLEPAEGAGVLSVMREGEAAQDFLLAKPVRINRGVWFGFAPLKGEFTVHCYFKSHPTVQSRLIPRDLPACRPHIRVASLFTAAYLEKSKHFACRDERHPFWELIYTDSGECTCVVEGEEHLLMPGQLLLCPPNAFHAIYACPGQAVAFAELTFELDCIQPLPLDLRVRWLNGPAQTHLYEIVRRCKGHGLFNEDKILHHLELLLVELASRGTEAKTDRPASGVCSSGRLSAMRHTVEQACRLIKQKIAAPELSAAYVAESLTVSESYLYRCFRQVLGCGVAAYINGCKLDVAKRLIQEGEQTLSQISADLNFCSQTYFSTKFKERYQITPSEYSRSMMGQSPAETMSGNCKDGILYRPK